MIISWIKNYKISDPFLFKVVIYSFFINIYVFPMLNEIGTLMFKVLLIIKQIWLTNHYNLSNTSILQSIVNYYYPLLFIIFWTNDCLSVEIIAKNVNQKFSIILVLNLKVRNLFITHFTLKVRKQKPINTKIELSKHLSKLTVKKFSIYTGWTLILIFKITLQLNYKTYRKSEDGFGLDPFKRDLEQHGVLQVRRTNSRCINTTKRL